MAFKGVDDFVRDDLYRSFHIRFIPRPTRASGKCCCVAVLQELLVGVVDLPIGSANRVRRRRRVIGYNNLADPAEVIKRLAVGIKSGLLPLVSTRTYKEDP